SQDRLEDDALADAGGVDPVADGVDTPDRLVAHHERRNPPGAGFAEPVQVGAAHRRHRGRDHHVAGTRDRVIDVLQLHLPWAHVDERLHRSLPAATTKGTSRGGTTTVTARSSSAAASTTRAADPRFRVNRSWCIGTSVSAPIVAASQAASYSLRLPMMPRASRSACRPLIGSNVTCGRWDSRVASIPT